MDLQVAEGEARRPAPTVQGRDRRRRRADRRRGAHPRCSARRRRPSGCAQEYEQLKPLLEKGFITRDELARTGDELEQAEEELALARRRTDVVVQMTHPREQKRAALQLAQKARAARQRAHARAGSAGAPGAAASARSTAARIYARGPGLVVYEEYLNANPRRKMRVGDRVYAHARASSRFPKSTACWSKRRSAKRRCIACSRASRPSVRLEAFPDLRLTGKVARVGTLASSSIDRPLDDKRFDLIVELDPTTAELRPEMTARADIVVGTRDRRAAGAGQRGLRAAGRVRRLRRRPRRHRDAAASISANRTIAWSRSSPACARASACCSPIPAAAAPPAPDQTPRPARAANALQPR